MYTVIHYDTSDCSPAELAAWLNKQWEKGLELVAADNGFYIFKQRNNDTVDISYRESITGTVWRVRGTESAFLREAIRCLA